MIGIQSALNPENSINHGWKQEIMPMKSHRSVMIAIQNIL